MCGSVWHFTVLVADGRENNLVPYFKSGSKFYVDYAAALAKIRVVKLIDRQRISTVWTVKGGHGQWTARCPAHDDRRASLRFRGRGAGYC